jgi:hypothetical protein
MELVSVRFRDCACPGTPHTGTDGADDGDIARFRPHLNYVGGVALVAAFQAGQVAAATGDIEGLATYVGPAYLRHGMVGWNLLDAEGNPVPFDAAKAVDELPFGDALGLVERADDLYGKAVLDPLAQRTANSSRRGRTNGNSQTSEIPTSSPRRPSRSARSSRAKASAGN